MTSPGIPRRVLVAEDSPAVGQMLVEALSSKGRHVDLVSDGQAALERIAEVRYDLVIADVTLPVLDGFALYAELVRRRPELLDRFVLITGWPRSSMPRLTAFRVETGVPVLEKPFHLADLEAVVEPLLAGDIATSRVTFSCPLCRARDELEVILVAELDLTISFPVVGNIYGCPHAKQYGKMVGLTRDEERRLIAAALAAWNANPRVMIGAAAPIFVLVPGGTWPDVAPESLTVLLFIVLVAAGIGWWFVGRGR